MQIVFRDCPLSQFEPLRQILGWSLHKASLGWEAPDYRAILIDISGKFPWSSIQCRSTSFYYTAAQLPSPKLTAEQVPYFHLLQETLSQLGRESQTLIQQYLGGGTQYVELMIVPYLNEGAKYALSYLDESSVWKDVDVPKITKVRLPELCELVTWLLAGPVCKMVKVKLCLTG